MKRQIIQKLLTTMLTISCCTVLIGGTGVFTSSASKHNNTNINLKISILMEKAKPDYCPLSDDEPFNNDTE